MVSHRALSWVLCCFYYIYINDLRKAVNNAYVPVLFADDASILFTLHKTDNLNADMYNTFKIINKWFRANLLSLNYEKPQHVQFRTQNAMQIDRNIIYGNNII